MPLHLAATVGRIIIGLYFLTAGVGKLFDTTPDQQIVQMTANGIPAADLLFVLAAACETIAGLCFIIGLHVRLVAVLLAAFTVFVSVKLHAFWLEPEGNERLVQTIMFLKNIATMGGLLAFAGFGSGPIAMDRLYGKE